MTEFLRSRRRPIATFERDDGETLVVVEGFRERVLSARPSKSPKAGWNGADFSGVAQALLRRSKRRLSELARWGGSLDGARVLDVGCGGGADALLTALGSAQSVDAIDLELRLVSPGEQGDLARRLASTLLEQLGIDDSLEDVLARLQLRFSVMDATRLAFADASFDFIWSRSAMEHIAPPDRALAEIARVVRPGGLICVGLDPYFSLRGCHKRGLVDLPWAHARLSVDEFRRFVVQTEGEARADKRCQRLATLNQLTLQQWRQLIEAGPFEILDYEEVHSPFAESLLDEHRDVEETLLEGVKRRDLIHSYVRVWLRRVG